MNDGFEVLVYCVFAKKVLTESVLKETEEEIKEGELCL
jgi:hypothetical protein